MFRSLVLGKIFGVPIKLHWSYYFVLIYAALELIADPSRGLGLLIILTVLSFSVIAHELSHSLVARKFRINTFDILLTPIGGIARLSNLPATPRQEILVAAAGPAMTFLISLITFPFLNTMLYQYSDPETFLTALFQFTSFEVILAFTSFLNLFLGFFNLIPAFPMDGGRIFRASLQTKFGIVRATEIAASIGKFLALAGGVYGIMVSSFNFIFIAIFIYITSSIELSMIRRREMMRQMGGSPFNQQFQVDLMNLFKIFSAQANQRQYYQHPPNAQPESEDKEVVQLNPQTDYIEYKGQQVYMPDKSNDDEEDKQN